MRSINKLFILFASIFLFSGILLYNSSYACAAVNLSKPVITAPTSSTITKGNVTVSWNSVSGAVKYFIGLRDVTTGESGPLLISPIEVRSTSYTISSSYFTEGHKYKVWVGAAASASATPDEAPGSIIYFTITKPADTTAPAVTSTSPANNAVNVPVNSSITVNFSENIVQGNYFNNITVKRSDNTSVTIYSTLSSGKLTITRSGNWEYNTKYTVTIPAGAVKDAAGNGCQAYTFVFTTVNLDKPVITAPTSSTITKGNVTVSWNSVSGAVKYFIGLRDVTTGESGPLLISPIEVRSTSYTISSSYFTEGHKYKVWVGAAASASATPDEAPGSIIYFTITKPADTTAPAVTSTSPANNAVNVPVNSSITVNFSENIVQGNYFNNITVKRSDNTSVTIYSTLSSGKLTITRSGNWEYNTKYTVTIPAGAVKDAAGNGCQAYTFVFTTVANIPKITNDDWNVIYNSTQDIVEAIVNLGYKQAPPGSPNIYMLVKDANGNLVFKGDDYTKLQWNNPKAPANYPNRYYESWAGVDNTSTLKGLHLTRGATYTFGIKFGDQVLWGTNGKGVYTIPLKLSLSSTIQKNIDRLISEGNYGAVLQEKVRQRADGIMEFNRPYKFDGVSDCYGFVRQVWNPILADGSIHSEDFNKDYNNNSKKLERINITGGLPVASYPDSDWVKITNLNDLCIGDVLATHQGHKWGGDWHGGIYAGKDVNGNHLVWDCSSSKNGAYKRGFYSGFKYYYKPIHDVLAKSISPTGVCLNKTSTTIGVGSSEVLTATVIPANATSKTVTWKSSNTNVATVDQSGKVTGVSAGIATITVTTVDGNKTATCTVTVTAPLPAPAIKEPANNSELSLGEFLAVKWNSVSGASKFKIKASDVTNLQDLKQDGIQVFEKILDSANVTSFNIPGSYFQAGKKYRVGVVAIGPDGKEGYWGVAIITFKPSVTLPAVSIAATDPNASEGGTDTGKFTISRTGSTSTALTVNFTVGGTATNGTDYNTIPGSVTIPAGSSSADIIIAPKGDMINESSETVIITLSSSSSYKIGTNNSATVTIIDNGQAAGTVETPVFNPAGGTYAVAQSVTITCATSGATIRYTKDGSEPTASSAQYSGPIPISTTTTLKAKAFKSGMKDSATASATYTITSATTEKATVSVEATVPTAPESGKDSGIFTITRSGNDISKSLTVSYKIEGTAAKGIDYIVYPPATTITIPAGKTSTSIRITAKDNQTYNGNKYVIMTLLPGTSYTITKDKATVTILDDELPTPTGLKATVENPSQVKNNKINLSWDTINATGCRYEIYRSMNNGKWWERIATVDKNSYQDAKGYNSESLSAHYSYWYCVRAVGSNGQKSDFSSVVFVLGVPEFDNVYGGNEKGENWVINESDIGSNSITVRWLPAVPVDVENAVRGILTYELVRKKERETSWTSLKKPITGNSYYDTKTQNYSYTDKNSLSPSTTYYYKVTAYYDGTALRPRTAEIPVGSSGGFGKESVKVDNGNIVRFHPFDEWGWTYPVKATTKAAKITTTPSVKGGIIPIQLDQLAQRAAELTKLNKQVIEAHWIAENGWKIPWHFNFGNIRYYEKAKKEYYPNIIGTFNSKGEKHDKPINGEFAIYKDADSGLMGYVNLMNLDSNYKGIRDTIGKSPEEQITAISKSPWCAGGYTTLLSIYKSVLNSVIK